MEITDSNFDNIVQAESIAVVVFGAPWCGNCRHFLPVLEEVAGEMELPFYKLVVDDNPQSTDRFDVHPVPFRFDVRGVPTVIVFQDGKERGRFVGTLSPKETADKIAEILS